MYTTKRKNLVREGWDKQNHYFHFQVRKVCLPLKAYTRDKAHLTARQVAFELGGLDSYLLSLTLCVGGKFYIKTWWQTLTFYQHRHCHHDRVVYIVSKIEVYPFSKQVGSGKCFESDLLDEWTFFGAKIEGSSHTFFPKNNKKYYIYVQDIICIGLLNKMKTRSSLLVLRTA